MESVFTGDLFFYAKIRLIPCHKRIEKNILCLTCNKGKGYIRLLFILGKRRKVSFLAMPLLRAEWLGNSFLLYSFARTAVRRRSFLWKQKSKRSFTLW